MSLLKIENGQRILSFFAHPDDEVLAAGATFAKFIEAGAHLRVAIPATGIHSRRNVEMDLEKRTTQLDQLREDTRSALGVLGIPPEEIVFGDFADNELDTYSQLELNHWLESVMRDFQPDIIFTHHLFCSNVDHRRCHEAAVIASRPSPDKQITVIAGEVPSSTGYLRPSRWEPNLYVEISEEQLEKKLVAMENYRSERRGDPHPRSSEVLRALAKVRGSESGCRFAESFMIQRLIA